MAWTMGEAGLLPLKRVMPKLKVTKKAGKVIGGEKESQKKKVTKAKKYD